MGKERWHWQSSAFCELKYNPEVYYKLCSDFARFAVTTIDVMSEGKGSSLVFTGGYGVKNKGFRKSLTYRLRLCSCILDIRIHVNPPRKWTIFPPLSPLLHDDPSKFPGM